MSTSSTTAPDAGLNPVASLADAYTADEDAPLIVEPSDNRLADLHAAYDAAKAKADAAAKELKTITDGIKAELTQVVPDGTERIELRAAGKTALRLTYVRSWRLDSTRLKKEDPGTYARYAKQSGAWTLKAVGGAE